MYDFEIWSYQFFAALERCKNVTGHLYKDVLWTLPELGYLQHDQ